MENKALVPVNLNQFKSIQATDHAPYKSPRYTFIPTTDVVRIFQEHGWVPSKAIEKRARIESHIGFQEHMIRFRRPEDMALVESLITRQNHMARRDAPLAEFAEIVLVNSHDGGKAFNIMMGFFRLVCCNGLIVAGEQFATHRIKHVGFQEANVIEAVYDVVETAPKIANRIQDLKQIELDRPEQIIFAQAALTAKYGEPVEELNRRFNPELLVRPVRVNDTLEQDQRQYLQGPGRNSLWNTFNIAQEKLIEKGGRFTIDPNDGGRGRKARPIASVSENVRVNQALWLLAEKMAEMKGAGKAAL
jgi:hypothetical protein